MNEAQKTTLASIIIVISGAFWGLYWIPIRRIDEAGLPGAWGTLVAICIGAATLAPVVLWRRKRLAGADPWALFYVAVGGAAFVLYSVGFIYGRIAIIILLFYLTPVWSSLIGRYVLGWRNRTSRTLVIIVGLLGLLVMLGADSQAPLPQSVGEWFALGAGMLWSVSSTGIRLKPDLDPLGSSFVFAAGALIVAVPLAFVLSPVPEAVPDAALGPLIGWSLAAGLGWWAASTAGILWATAQLEPARVGILLMSEVLVGAVSGAVLAGETLGPMEWVGGALVLAAGGFEVWSTRPRRQAALRQEPPGGGPAEAQIPCSGGVGS
ncbi:EamA family transporter [Aquicoccus sp. SCR17]|nr:EamA family transporter [Carideicomes alvinocaridis]